MFVKLRFQSPGNSCCEIPHVVSFWREMCGGSPEDESSERRRAFLRVWMPTRARRGLAGDHRHDLLMKWIVGQLVLQLLSSCGRMASVTGPAAPNCRPTLIQSQRVIAPLPVPQLHRCFFNMLMTCWVCIWDLMVMVMEHGLSINGIS